MAKFGVRLGIIASLLATAAISAEEPTGFLPSIVEIKGRFGENNLDRRAAMPIEVRSADEAAKIFEGRSLRDLLEQVDFERQYVAVLAWAASGHDRVEAKDDVLDPKQVTLRIVSSMHCDLADNLRVFAVRSDMRCRYLGRFDPPPEPATPPSPGAISIVGFGEPRPEPHRVVYRIEEATVEWGKLPHGTYVELRDGAQAAEYFSGLELKQLLDEVDFERQYVLAFAWVGSQGDDVQATFDETNPTEVLFRLTPGHAFDACPHIRVYAIQSGAAWTLRKQP